MKTLTESPGSKTILASVLTGGLLATSLFVMSPLVVKSPLVFADEHESVMRDVQAGRLKPLAEILQSLQSTHPGRVLDVDLEQAMNGVRWYEITLLDESGQRVELYIDAVSGVEIQRPVNSTQLVMPISWILGQVLPDESAIVLQADLEQLDDLSYIYEIELLMPNGTEQLIRADATTGAIIDEPLRELSNTMQLLSVMAMLDDLEARYQGSITEIELKRSRTGMTFYEIDLTRDNGRDLELIVHAQTGEVLEEDGR